MIYPIDSAIWLVLVVMSLASVLVSMVGYRNFLFGKWFALSLFVIDIVWICAMPAWVYPNIFVLTEIYYFTFIFVLGINLALMAHTQSNANWTAIAIVIVPAASLAAIWTAVCRWSENLKLALSMHSLVLSTWITLTGLELIILSIAQWPSVLLIVQDTLTANFNWVLVVGSLLVHTILFYSFDLFWVKYRAHTNTQSVRGYILTHSEHALFPFQL